MNDALTTPGRLGMVHVGEMLAAPGLGSRWDIKEQIPAEKLVTEIIQVVDALVCATLDAKTASEFKQRREETFPQYFEATRALTDLARIMVPRHTLDCLTAQSFSETETVLQAKGLEAFGAEVRDQAVFTIWTLRKISALCCRVDACNLRMDLWDFDSELHRRFVHCALGSRFHVDCLLKSMQYHKPLYPEVLREVIDGLRGAVDAYTWVRRAYDLRVPPTREVLEPVSWDEEDEELLSEANQDFIGEPQ